MSGLSLCDVRKSYGAVEVIHGIDLEIERGEFVVFVGPSGCGKSTLLRMIAGLENVSSGTIGISGKVVNDVPSPERGISMVFQSYALYPHMSVADNMGFGLKVRRSPIQRIRETVASAAKTLQLDNYLDRFPKALSGGQRQRVAIGRAIVREPEVFLFDEPLSNLDANLRNRTRIEIARLHRSLDATMVYVTHDQIEALTLATRIAVLKDGVLQQFDTPDRVYNRPTNTFVAGFMGAPPMNLIDARVACDGSGLHAVLHRADADSVHVPLPDVPALREREGRSVVFGLRPEAVTHRSDEVDPARVQMTCLIDYVEVTGADRIAMTEFAGGRFLARLPARAEVQEGDRADLGFALDQISVFDRKTGLRIETDTETAQGAMAGVTR